MVFMIDNTERILAERREEEIQELIREWEFLSSFHFKDKEKHRYQLIRAEEIENILKYKYDYEL